MQFTLAADPGLKVCKAPVKADPRAEGLNPVLPNYNFCMLISGTPGSGKSTVIFNLLTQRRGGSYRGKFDAVYIFCTSQTLKFPGIPDECCVPSLDFDFINEVLEDPELQGKNVLFVLDDVVQEMKANSRELLKIMFNRRHVFNKLKNSHKDKGKDKKENALIESIAPDEPGDTGIRDDDESYSDDEIPTGSLSIMMTTQKYNAIPLKFRTVADSLILFKPDVAEASILNKEVLCKYLPTQGTNAHIPLCNFVFDDEHNFMFIDKKRDRIYKNFRRINVE